MSDMRRREDGEEMEGMTFTHLSPGAQENPVEPRKNAVGYIRVSTINQVGLDSYGLTVQRESIEQYCQERDINLLEIYSDEAISGTLPPEKRPAMTALMAFAATNRPDIVLVPKFDRLARDLFYHLTLERAFEKMGIELISVQEGKCSDDPQAQLQRGIFALFSQYELSVITTRMRAGRAAKMARGGYGGGGVPYGFTVGSDGM
ncbi:MAG: recombinase family protein, partial [Synergistales bacterium]|nr:recombinase family protein [Synergistales bacterium]